MAPPYSEWDVPAIAQFAGYVKWRVLGFDFAQFPGYMHRTTLADAKHLDTCSSRATGKTVTLVFRRMQQADPSQVHQGTRRIESLPLQADADREVASDPAVCKGGPGNGAFFVHFAGF